MTQPGLERLARALTDHKRSVAGWAVAYTKEGEARVRKEVRAILTALKTEAETNEGMIEAGARGIRACHDDSWSASALKAMIEHLLGEGG